MVRIGQWIFACLVLATVFADRPLTRLSDVTYVTHVEEEELSVVPLQEVDEAYRLPATAVPTHYTVKLRTEIHSNDRTFTGTVDVHLDVLEPTSDIVMHNRNLVISRSTLYAVTDGVSQLVGDLAYSLVSQYEHATFTSTTVLQPGSYILTVEYTGRLSTNDDGFYVSSYVDDNDVRRYLATTQFESTSARTAFPCFDEPALKATITLWITHHNTYSAISNMAADNRETLPEDTQYVITKFPTTPKMSTYLLAFVVSDFLYRVNSVNTPQRVYVRPNAFNEAMFGLEAGVKILDALDEYTRLPYTTYMPKMDQIAIPDFAAGAMENWGLVTYREQYLLFNPAVNTYRTKTSVATTIAHEYAHQWFGDLVSPQWWEFIWLNEGFATLYEYYATHLAYPEDNYWEMFNPQVIQAAMVPDALESTRPMNWNAATPGQISNLFDRVAYPKSGSVLNMMRNVLGDDNWRDGLYSYFIDRQLDAANDEHLYAGLQTGIEGKNVLPGGVTVAQIMRTWTHEPGYPVLSVRRSYDTGDVIISQERFYSDRKVPNSNVWMVPYNFATQSAPDFEQITFDWLATKAARISTTASANQWILFNKQQVGYYRVNYDEQNWRLLTNALIDNLDSVHRLNRAQLIDDAYWLARSGRLDLGIALELMTYLRTETEYAPWTAANNALTYFNNKLRGTESYNHFTAFVQHLIENMYAGLLVDAVPDSEKHLDKYVKQTISTWACAIGYSDCLSRTRALLSAAATNTAVIHPDIASVVYCYGMRTADETMFVYVYRKMMDSKNLAERTMLIDSLGCSHDKSHLNAFLTTALGSGTGTEINYNADERSRVVQAVYSGSRVGVDALIEFLMDQTTIGEFVSSLGTGMLNSAISNIASRTNNEAELEQLNALLTSLGSRITTTTADNARNSVQSNFKWYSSLEGLVAMDFLQEFVDPTQTTTEPSTTTTEPSTTTESSTTTSTTVVPVTTTEAPVTTPVTPEVTTATPETTTEAPVTTPVTPEVTTVTPVTTTEAPIETTEAPTTEPPTTTEASPETTTEGASAAVLSVTLLLSMVSIALLS